VSASPAAPPPASGAIVIVHRVTHPPSPPSSAKTAERLAADAVHTGDIRRAVALYRELAEANPEIAVFEDAARILSARIPP
jgi:hypothetical protein